MIDRKELRQGLKAWLPLGHRRRSNQPEEAVKVWSARHGTLLFSRQPGPDPWAAAQAQLDRQLDEFLAIEKRMAQAALRDGLAEDGPMVPTLKALHLCIASLREMTRIASQIPNHYVDNILNALSASRTVAEAETDRFRAEIDHTAADIVRRIAHSIAESADQALARRVRVFDRNTAFAAALILFMTAGGCLGGGYWWGSSNATAGIPLAEAVLQATLKDNPVDAAKWISLISWNHIAASLSFCTTQTNVQHGRRECDVPLWLEPEPVPTLESLPTNVTPVQPPSPPPPPARIRSKPINPLGILPVPPKGPLHFGPEESQ